MKHALLVVRKKNIFDCWERFLACRCRSVVLNLFWPMGNF